MKTGQLDVEELDRPYVAVVQLRHQAQGVLHQVVLRPDKVKQIMRQCSMGHYHKTAVIVLGETGGDQAAGWQHPENVWVVAILGVAQPPIADPEMKTGALCRPLEESVSADMIEGMDESL